MFIIEVLREKCLSLDDSKWSGSDVATSTMFIQDLLADCYLY